MRLVTGEHVWSEVGRGAQTEKGGYSKVSCSGGRGCPRVFMQGGGVRWSGQPGRGLEPEAELWPGGGGAGWGRFRASVRNQARRPRPGRPAHQLPAPLASERSAAILVSARSQAHGIRNDNSQQLPALGLLVLISDPENSRAWGVSKQQPGLTRKPLASTH